MLYSRIEHSQSSLKLMFQRESTMASRQTQEGKATTDYVLHSSLSKAPCRPDLSYAVARKAPISSGDCRYFDHLDECS